MPETRNGGVGLANNWESVTNGYLNNQYGNGQGQGATNGGSLWGQLTDGDTLSGLGNLFGQVWGSVKGTGYTPYNQAPPPPVSTGPSIWLILGGILLVILVLFLFFKNRAA